MDLKLILNDALNKALVGKSRIREGANSNIISEFVNNYLKGFEIKIDPNVVLGQSYKKDFSQVKTGDFIVHMSGSGSNNHLYTIGKKYKIIKIFNPGPGVYRLKFFIKDDFGKLRKIRPFLPLGCCKNPIDECIHQGYKNNSRWKAC